MHLNSAFRIILVPIAFACFACTSGAYAQGNILLNFENLSNPPNANGFFNAQGQSVMQNGFTVTDNSGGLFSVAPNAGNSGFNYTNTVALFNITAGATSTLTQNNGNIFTLNSIDIANLFTQAAQPGGTVVVFTGNLQNGGTVTQSFTHGANNNLETVTFDSSFSNLTSVSFSQSQNGPSNQFDNINIFVNSAPVPETSTLISLAVLSIAGIGFVSKRRNHS